MDARPALAAQSPNIEPPNGHARKLDQSTPVSKTLEPPPTGPQRSFAERKAQMSRPPPLNIVERAGIMRDIGRPPPGDVSGRSKRSKSKPELTKQRSHYFEDVFAVKEANPAKDRVLSESIVMADVRTNVIITDEFTFITELSYHLSTRYQRPVSSIVVTLHHGACMVFGGTFDPAYVLSVFALPEQLQPTTNKRNASLIQKHMEEAIGVKPSRGFLRFIPTLEEHTARNGKTLAGEIDDLEKGSTIIPSEDPIVIPRSRSKSKKRVSVRSFGTFRSLPAAAVPAPEPTPPASAGGNGEAGARPPIHLGTDLSGPPARTAKRSKSFMSTFFGLS